MPSIKDKATISQAMSEKRFLSHLEMSEMDDETLVDAVTPILGATIDICKHCRAAKPVREFIQAIRRRSAKKGGICAEFMPKTCDKQMFTNDRSNPFNNPCYAKVRRAADDHAKLDALKDRDMLAAFSGISPHGRIMGEERRKHLMAITPTKSASTPAPYNPFDDDALWESVITATCPPPPALTPDELENALWRYF